MHPKYFVHAYMQRFGKEPTYMALAPGRVNLLGEHVDYNDGFVCLQPSTGQRTSHSVLPNRVLIFYDPGSGFRRTDNLDA